MRTFAQKQNHPQEAEFSNSARSRTAKPGLHYGADLIPCLQRSIGNHAVQRLLRAHAEELKTSLTGTASPLSGHDFSRIPLHPPAEGAIQTKLAINQSGDFYEQEADRVANLVMRMHEAQLQRACACGGTHPKRQTERPNQEYVRLQTNSLQAGVAAKTSAPLIVRDILRSPGQPLDAKTRSYFEPRFGYDFSQVRVHISERAAESARRIDAMAYTAGREIVFGKGKYAPETTGGKYLLAHELTHTIQQGVQTQTSALVQRIPQLPLEAYRIYYLRSNIQALVDKNIKDYVSYRDTISKSTPIEKQIVLGDQELLSALINTLDHLSFARCVELLGRKAPTFDELRKNSVVAEAIKDAWQASDVGTRDLVTQPHEEGGWVFMNLIDGSLSIERAKAEGTDFIRVEPPPDVENSVLVAIFHTHPHLGPTAKPSRDDKREDARRGVPNLVAGNTGTKPDVFQIFLSGPAVRKHLGSETKIPGSSGGIAP